MSDPGRWAAAAFVAGAVLSGSIGGGLPVRRATAGAAAITATSSPVIRLVDQDLRVDPERTANFTVRITGDLGQEATIVVSSYLPAETRGDLREAIDDGPRGRPVDQLELLPSDLPRDAQGDYRLRIVTRTGAGPEEQLKVGGAGMIPITIDVRLASRAVSSLTTFVEQTDESELSSPVRIAVVTRVDSPPTLGPDGTTTIPAATRNALDRLNGLLTAHPGVPMTIALRPELLEGLTRSEDPSDAARLAQLRSEFGAGSIDELLPQTYVSIDPSGAVEGGLGIELGDQLLHGNDVTARALGVSPGRLWLLDAPTDADGLGLLRYLGIQQLVVDSAERSDLPTRDGALGTPAALDAPMPSLLGDAVVEDRLARPGADPVLRAYQVVADLMVMSMEAERIVADVEDGSVPLGLAIDLGDPASLPPALVDTLLGLIADNPRIVLGTGSDVIAELGRESPGGELERFTTLVPQPGASGPAIADELARLRAAISTTATMLPTGDGRPALWSALVGVFPADNLDETTRDLYADQLDGEIGDVRNCVTVANRGRISLGGRTSNIPITLENSCPDPLQVRVALASSKLILRETSTTTIVSDRAVVEIPVEAKTNGVFTVTVELYTPGGDPPAVLTAPVELTVRSTALTGLGQVISGALLVVLATWWVQHARSRRRGRRAEAAALTATGHPSAGKEPSGSHAGDRH